jgi:hypothetical protein
VAQDRVRWRALVTTALIIVVSWNDGCFLTSLFTVFQKLFSVGSVGWEGPIR